MFMLENIKTSMAQHCQKEFSVSKHSPGPWQKCGAKDCICGMVWVDPPGVHIATVHLHTDDFDIPEEMFRANLSLIVAAPTLLEFCEEVARGPYPDSDPASLLETLQKRAQAILKEIDNDES